VPLATEVVGLARSADAATRLADSGISVRDGDLADLARLISARTGVDAVVHTAVGVGGGFGLGRCETRSCVWSP
jgi:uncharacterized protein YbjT (DUF2867 family)